MTAVDVFVDVDHTIVGSDGSLRPGTHEALARLRADGHRVHLWSGEGPRWEVVDAHGLEPLLDGVHAKPTSDYQARLAEVAVRIVPDFVVDDYPHIVRVFGGLVIPPYYGRRRPDDAITLVPEIIAAGLVDHPCYQPPVAAHRRSVP